MRHHFLTYGFVVGALVLTSGCGLEQTLANKLVDPKAEFLNFVPSDEAGAPHNMEWLVEHDAGYGGYYGTTSFPGTLNIKNANGSNKLSGPGTYEIEWSFPNGHDYQFELKISPADSNGDSSEVLTAKNGDAMNLFQEATTVGVSGNDSNN
ncbi:MAG: hypothetical protein K6T76_10545 [Alicyclobacillus mali]|uniref:hypothetical protein n=1 Tax=Alicyclobacillus mali (ex Roth et al. 2021) TaxID=1123961 RepID=UPI0023F2230D|nr:hypothetical protein [Alicyclobacillus mali (ex Roth et al. 2021)]MCL6489353.1 hypothetical protein [Alicyclobacillus mali (ex Roth et al. 2021)]